MMTISMMMTTALTIVVTPAEDAALWRALRRRPAGISGTPRGREHVRTAEGRDKLETAGIGEPFNPLTAIREIGE